MSHLAQWIRTPLAQALGWTLVHFIWEGSILAAVLMALLRLRGAAPARRRYTLACLILAAMPLAFAITFGVIWARRPMALAAKILWSPVPSSEGPISTPVLGFSWAAIFDRLAWLVPVWAVGVAFFYARGLAGWAAVRRLRHRGVCAAPPVWQTRLNDLAARLRLLRPVALLESCFTDTPVLVGYLRPVILLPLGCLTGLSTAQVECILLHELAHMARHDYLVNLLQSLVEGLLFYHPAVWWVSRARLRRHFGRTGTAPRARAPGCPGGHWRESHATNSSSDHGIAWLADFGGAGCLGCPASGDLRRGFDRLAGKAA
jgi:Zn-dependent protease with chaperone function